MQLLVVTFSYIERRCQRMLVRNNNLNIIAPRIVQMCCGSPVQTVEITLAALLCPNCIRLINNDRRWMVSYKAACYFSYPSRPWTRGLRVQVRGNFCSSTCTSRNATRQLSCHRLPAPEHHLHTRVRVGLKQPGPKQKQSQSKAKSGICIAL